MFSIESLRHQSFDRDTLLSHARACQLSARSVATIQSVMISSWGFSACRVFDGDDARAVMASYQKTGYLIFRGHEPCHRWLPTIGEDTCENPAGGRVGTAYLKAFRQLESTITRYFRENSNHIEELAIAGHGFGGSIAAIASTHFDRSYRIANLTTFGQPRTGDSEFEQNLACHLGCRFLRLVNGEDPIPNLPPQLASSDSTINLVPTKRTGTRFPSPQSANSLLEVEQLATECQRLLEDHNETASPINEDSLRSSLEGLFPALVNHHLDRYVAAILHLGVSGKSKSAPTFLSVAKGSTSRGLARSVDNTPLIPVLIRTRNPHWQPPKGLRVNSRFDNFVSAQARTELIEILNRDPDVVSVESSRDGGVPDLTESIPFVQAQSVHSPPLEEKGDSAIVGIIDSSIDVLHESFRDDQGQTRILTIWNQSETTGPTPKQFDPRHFTQDYGTVYTKAEIDPMVQGAVPPPTGLRPRTGIDHGSHVASIAAGRRCGELPDGMAPQAKIMVVVPHNVTKTGAPPSLGYLNSHVDALHFLKTAAQGNNSILHDHLPIAINVSQGMNAGAHDGTSSLEAAFDSVSSKGQTPGFVIVKSAGNERGKGSHARIRPFQGLIPLHLVSQDIWRREDYVELWYDKFDKLTFRLVDPAGNRSEPISETNPYMDILLGGNRCQCHLQPLHPDNGDKNLTLRITPKPETIQPGTWTLEIEGEEILSESGYVDCWIERNERRTLRFKQEEPHGTLNIPGTADTVISVAACHRQQPLMLTPDSSYGRTRNGGAKPDLCAPGAAIEAAYGGQIDSAAATRMSGTSMAAPHVTGALALVLSRCQKETKRPLFNARQLRAALIRTTRSDCRRHHEGFGFGLLDTTQLFKTLCETT